MVNPIFKYSCINCNFTTNIKQDYNRHILTAKHLKSVKLNDAKLLIDNYFICMCGREYKHNTSLYAHKKKCKFESENIMVPIEISPKMVMDLIKQNNEFKEMIEDQHKQLVKMSETPNIINNTNTTKFNLNIFLNEKCKDAINITDFVESLQMQLKDLDNFGAVGYVQNISNILIKGLKSVDIYKRPIHCSDLKREIMYIKDHNAWEKDKEQTHMTKAIKKIAFGGIKRLPEWENMHPGYTDPDHKNNDKYLKMVDEMMGGATDEDDLKNYNKICKNVMKEIIIGKS